MKLSISDGKNEFFMNFFKNSVRYQFLNGTITPGPNLPMGGIPINILCDM